MSENDRYIIVIDAGTGSGRAVIFDLAGKQVSVSQREWLPKSNPRYPGALDFDTKEAWEILSISSKEAIAKAKIDPQKIIGVTATSMREGMVLYNQKKEVIWACPNVDARATAEVIEMVKQELARPICKVGGDWLSIISPPRLWWIRKNQPEIYDQIAHLNMLSDWVLFELSGELVTDPTIGSSSGIFDIGKRKWSDEIVKMAGLPQGIYPPVHESGSIIGKVTAKAAQVTGIPEGTPVITSGGDTQLALIGVGAVEPNMYTLCAGTFWQCTVVADKPIIDPQFRLRTGCHAVPGQWMPEGIGFYLGFTMRWFRDGFCQEEKRLAQETGEDAYTLMERLAQRIPVGSNGVQAIFSYFMDIKQWRHASPSFVGFNIVDAEASGKAACIRAIEENAAYVSRGHAEVLTEMTKHAPEELIFCGGSSKGFLWPQIISDVMGVPVKIPVVKESTALGSAMCVMIAMGEAANWKDAVERVVRIEKTIDPDPKSHARYDETYDLWKKVYKYMLPVSDDGILPALWRAPGV
jgi:autoinducer-2 kinase